MILSAMVIGIVNTSGADTDVSVTGWSIPNEQQFLQKLDTLCAKYPDGSIWEGVYYEYGSAKAVTCLPDYV